MASVAENIVVSIVLAHTELVVSFPYSQPSVATVCNISKHILGLHMIGVGIGRGRGMAPK